MPIELIFFDVWGPSLIFLSNRNKYYVSFVDHFNKYTWPFPVSHISDIMKVFISFQILVERQFNCKIKLAQTDLGTEFCSLHTFFANIGIQHQVTRPHTSKQNGSIERKHCYIVEIGLSYC